MVMTKKRRLSDDSTVQKHKKKIKYLSETKLKEISSLFLSDKKHANLLIDFLDQIKKPSETPVAYVSALENIFVEVLKRKELTIEETEIFSEAEKQYKDWLRGCYVDAWEKLLKCLKKGTTECKLQTLNSLFNMLSVEAKFPLDKQKKKKRKKSGFPLHRLQEILRSLSTSNNIDEKILIRLSELFNYKDIHCNLWLAADQTCTKVTKENPNDDTFWNLILVLSKVPKAKKVSDIVFCDIKNGVPDEKAVMSAVESVWKQMSRWQLSSRTRQLMMVFLVEHVMPRMQHTLFLTDYLTDALNYDSCEIQMIALQGIYNLVLKHNIEYPDIYGKLYQLFSRQSLKAKYKTRLFALADQFLRSTHLPLALVAAFAKRYAHLLIFATPPDQVVLLTSILNLLIRHPDLEPLYHKPGATSVDKDSYDPLEKDPLKSRALESQLYEVKVMQHSTNDRVVRLASVINGDLPNVEYPMDPVLDLTWDKMIQKEMKQLEKKIPLLAKFEDKPVSKQVQEAREKDIESIWTELNKYFTFKDK